MLKVLMSAYACEPNRGSEPGVGWNWAVQAARFHEVWVLTRANNREVIEAELAKHPQPNLHFIYHDLPRWAKWWKRGNRGVNLYAYLWQLTAIPTVGRAHASFGFDIAHHVTLVSFRHPSALAWCGIPYIWGPVAGGEEAPRSFYSIYGKRGALEQALRSMSNTLARVDPLVRRTARGAAIVFAATPDTARILNSAPIEPAIGMMEDTIPPRPPQTGLRPLRLLYVGNLLYLKGIQLALPAVAHAKAQGGECTLTLVGDGRFRSDLERSVQELGIDDIVEFRGKLRLEDVNDLYQDYDVFLFPSLRDSGGLAVLEAMASGLPVICVDLGGPGLSVTNDTGVRVEARTPSQVIQDLATAILQYANDPQLIDTHGQAGRERVRREYAWSRKGELLYRLYSCVVRQNLSREP